MFTFEEISGLMDKIQDAGIEEQVMTLLCVVYEAGYRDGRDSTTTAALTVWPKEFNPFPEGKEVN